MRIATYLNTTAELVEAKSYNIWIGVSLGNKYFTKENIEKYIKWSILHTKEKVLVVIPDILHAVNLEVLDHRTADRALKKAIKIGDVKAREVQEIIGNLSEDEKSKVRLVRWTDILQSDVYKNNIATIKAEFKLNSEFHDYIIDIVKHGRQDRAERLERLSSGELDKLAEYVLLELPHFVNGVQGYGDYLVYTLLPYPGLNKLDDLCIGLSNNTMFPELAKKLNLTNKIAILEAYVE